MEKNTEILLTETKSEKTPKKLSLKANFSWAFLGNLFFSGSQWLFVLILARCLTTDDVGLYSLGLAVAAPVFQLINLQLRTVLVTDHESKFYPIDYWITRVLCIIIAWIVLLICYLSSMYKGGQIIAIALTFLYKSVDSMMDIKYGRFQKNERMDVVARSMTLRGIVSLVALYLGVLITKSVYVGLFLITISWLFIFIFYDNRDVLFNLNFNLVNMSNSIRKYNFKRVFHLCIYAAPLGIVLFLVSLSNSIPKIHLEKYSNLSQLGVYSAISYFMVGGRLFTTAVGQSASSRLSLYFQKRRFRDFVTLTTKMTVTGLLVGLVGVLIAATFGHKLLGIIYGDIYAVYNKEFVVLMIANAIAMPSGFLGVALTATKKFKIQVVFAFTITVLTFIGSLLVIPKVGIMGAALIMVFTKVVNILMLFFTLRSIIQRSRANPVV